MTAVNIWLSADRVLIGTDTMTMPMPNPQRLFWETGKVAVLPHAGVVLAGRGLIHCMHVLHSLLLSHPAVVDLDSLDATMPAILRDHFTPALEVMPEPLRSSAWLHRQQFFIAGWSAAAGRMFAVMYLRLEAGQEFQRMAIAEPGFISPWEQDMLLPVDAPSTVALQVNLLAHQAAYTAGEEFQVGGRLVLADVTRGGITITTHDLPAVATAAPVLGGGAFGMLPAVDEEDGLRVSLGRQLAPLN
jgi:hypothetical protein